MASGHVNRANKAEHMAAPHRYLRREDFPCQFGAVHTWPLAADRVCPQPGQLAGHNGPIESTRMTQLGRWLLKQSDRLRVRSGRLHMRKRADGQPSRKRALRL